jgi:hypothetical protein
LFTHWMRTRSGIASSFRSRISVAKSFEAVARWPLSGNSSTASAVDRFDDLMCRSAAASRSCVTPQLALRLDGDGRAWFRFVSPRLVRCSCGIWGLSPCDRRRHVVGWSFFRPTPRRVFSGRCVPLTRCCEPARRLWANRCHRFSRRRQSRRRGSQFDLATEVLASLDAGATDAAWSTVPHSRCDGPSSAAAVDRSGATWSFESVGVSSTSPTMTRLDQGRRCLRANVARPR